MSGSLRATKMVKTTKTSHVCRERARLDVREDKQTYPLCFRSLVLLCLPNAEQLAHPALRLLVPILARPRLLSRGLLPLLRTPSFSRAKE